MPELTPYEAGEIVQRKRRARSGLLEFTAFTHPRWYTGSHHKRICDFIERIERGEIRRGIIDAPPRHSKTEIVSRRYPAYHLSKNPTHQVIISSYSDDLAHDISRDVRNIIKDDHYRSLCGAEDFPGVDLNPETTAGGRWETSKGGICVSAGCGAGITGRGADLLLIDDPHKDREDADSQRMREKIWNWFHGVAMFRLMPEGKVLIIMTRWHEQDLVGRLLETEGDKWELLSLPAMQNEGTDYEDALWPERYPIEELREIKLRLTRAGRIREWNAQYQQRPTAEEGIYVKREWFKDRYDEAPKLMRTYIGSDLAVTSKDASRFADWTVHIVAGLAEDGKLYILDAWRRRSEPNDWIDSLLSLVKTHRPMHWAGEAGVIRRATEGLIEKRCAEEKIFFDMKWISPVADKMTRGTTFKGWASMGRIVFPRTGWAEEIIDICVGFPTVRFDDAFDAMSTLCLSLDEAVAPVLPVKKVRVVDGWARVKAIAADKWLTR
jgi:predicted phage terminase large subunit-like protein